MARVASSVMTARYNAAATQRGWPALIVVAAVFGAALYSFSPRPIPPFPATRLYADRLMVDGLAHNAERYVGVAEQGHILLSDTPQGPWHDAQVEPQRGAMLTQVRFLSDQLALAVGHDCWIVRSTDGGLNWTETYFDPDSGDPLMGVAGPFDGRVFAFGAFGRLLVSTDQGQHWRKLDNDTIGDHHLYGLVQAADGALILAGERGLLARSTDGGETWQILPQIYTGSFFGILKLPDSALLAFGMRGNVYRSGDNGSSWQKSNTPGEISLFGGTVTASGEVALAGAGNTIYTSTDDGRSFKLISDSSRHDLAALLPLPDGRWLTAGDGGIRIETAVAAPKAADPEPHS